MTLCIAGECEHAGKPAIVLCCDWRAQRGTEFKELVGSDDVNKIREIAESTSALLAGSETEADRLLTACDPAILKFCATPVNLDSDIVITDLLRGLEKAAEDRKAEIIKHHVRMAQGIEYDELRKTPKDCLSDLDDEILHSIRGLTLGADVIIATFSDEAMIIRLDRYGKAHWETNYSVIGEGSDIALAFLCQQPWDFGGSSDPPTVGWVKALSLMQCLYRVYEAKKAAEKNRSVGESTAFSVLIKDVGRFEISDECRDILYDRFEKKTRVPTIEFEPSYLEADDGKQSEISGATLRVNK